MSESRRNREGLRWWGIGLIACLALVAAFKVYGPALAGPVLFDDYALPYALRSPAESFSSWLMGVRPVLMLSYWLNFRLFGPEPFSYHSVNVILHAINALLAGLIFRRVLLWYSTSPGTCFFCTRFRPKQWHISRGAPSLSARCLFCRLIWSFSISP